MSIMRSAPRVILTRQLLALLSVVAFASSQSSCVSENAELPLSDIRMAPSDHIERRPTWNESDVNRAMQNERLLAFIDSTIRNPVDAPLEIYDFLERIYGRPATADDWGIDGLPKLFDLPLTGEAGYALFNELTARMESGQIPSDRNWITKFPDLYKSRY